MNMDAYIGILGNLSFTAPCLSVTQMCLD